MIEKYEQFASSVLYLSRNLHRIQRTEMAKYGLKGSHAQCLITMSRFPDGITSVDLGKLADKDKAAISRTVAELEREGLIERRSQGGSLYRAKLVLTEAGAAAAEEIGKKAVLAVEQADRGLTEERRNLFYETLNLIAANLQQISFDGLQDTQTPSGKE